MTTASSRFATISHRPRLGDIPVESVRTGPIQRRPLGLLLGLAGGLIVATPSVFPLGMSSGRRRSKPVAFAHLVRFLPGILTTENKAAFVMTGLASALMVGFFEELGWIGFALPKLRVRYGLLTTGLIGGVLWGAWHLLGNDLCGGPTAGGGSPYSEELPHDVQVQPCNSGEPAERRRQACERLHPLPHLRRLSSSGSE